MVQQSRLTAIMAQVQSSLMQSESGFTHLFPDMHRFIDSPLTDNLPQRRRPWELVSLNLGLHPQDVNPIWTCSGRFCFLFASSSIGFFDKSGCSRIRAIENFWLRSSTR